MLKLIEKYSEYEKRKIKQLLDEDGVVWMSNTAREVLDMTSASRWFKGGKALIGGLGLGIIVNMIKPRADWIDVIELDKNVIDAVWPSVKSNNIQIFNDNVLDVPNWNWSFDTVDKWGYDFIYHDVWPDLDWLRLPAVYKLTQAYKPLLKPSGRILNWGEWLMRRAYKEELYVFIQDLRKYKLFEFPIGDLKKIKDSKPYFFPFCRWLWAHPGIWFDSNNERKIKNAIGRFTTEFVRGQQYLSIAQPTKGVAIYKGHQGFGQ